MELSIEALEARREYYRRWRKQNPEKVREHNLTYWSKQAERRKQEDAQRTEPELTCKPDEGQEIRNG